MSTTQLEPLPPRPKENRRSHLRRRLERLTYVHFDQDNGGILIDIGEGGLNFQGVAGLFEGEPCLLKFTLPGTANRIEAKGQIVWSNSSRKGGGVRFVELPEEVRLQIREWIAGNFEPAAAAKPLVKPGAKAAPEAPVVPDPSAKVGAESIPAAEEAPAANVPARENTVVAHAAAVAAPPVVPSSPPQVAKPSAQDKELPKESASPVVASAPGTLTFPRSESVFKSKVEKSAAPVDLPSRDLPKASSRAAQIAVVAASACVIAAAIAVGISRYPAILSSAVATTTPVAASGSAGSPASSTAVGVPPFKVDAVDANGRRWTLQNGGEVIAPAARENAESNPVQDDHVRDARPKSVAATHPAATRALALRLPRGRKATTAQGGLDAPAVAAGAISSSGLLDPGALSARNSEAPRPPQPEAVNVQTGFQPAVLIHSVQSRYPQYAAAEHLTGAVRVSVTINKTGVPSTLKVVSGEPRLAEAALENIRQWRYNPALLNGKPVESQVDVTVNFQLK